MSSKITMDNARLDELMNVHVTRTTETLVGEYTDLIVELIPYAIKSFSKYGDSVPTEHVIKVLSELIGYQRNCQYCDLTKRNKRALQNELNDAYMMLGNQDKTIKRLEANKGDSNE